VVTGVDAWRDHERLKMMNQETLNKREQVSALADGQLRGEAFARVVDGVGNDVDCRAAWHAYHVVGDVLRSRELAMGAGDAAFVSRFQARLQRDLAASAADAPQLLVAPDLIASYAHSTGASGQNHSDTHGALSASTRLNSANESSFRWKLLAGVASLAAVVAISWNALGSLGGPGNPGGASGAPQLAQLMQMATPPGAASGVQQLGINVANSEPQSEPQVMIRDPHLDALMAAHKQFGGTSALQMPAGFLRNATFEGAAR